MSRTRLLLVPVLAALATACDRPAPVATTPAAPPARHANLPLPERLATEARTRPPARVRPESLRQAMDAAGIPVPHWRQVLGSTIGARYCMAGQTSAGLTLALCEFDDPATADRGVAYSRDTFDRLIPGRRLTRKENAVLTVTAPPAAGPSVAGEAQRVTDIFAAL